MDVEGWDTVPPTTDPDKPLVDQTVSVETPDTRIPGYSVSLWRRYLDPGKDPNDTDPSQEERTGKGGRLGPGLRPNVCTPLTPVSPVLDAS